MMSVCIHRREGQINHQMMCGAAGRIGRCPSYRALFCIPGDVLKAVGWALWRPFKKMFFTVY